MTLHDQIDFLERINDQTWRMKLLVQPGARTSQVAGRHGGRIRIRIQAPAADGKANKHLLSFLADVLGIKKQQMCIDKGLTSRQKSVIIYGVNDDLWSTFLRKHNGFN